MASEEIFTAKQMTEIAVQTEQVGGAFYTAAAQATEDPQVHALCEWLRDEEAVHERIFGKMRDALADDAPEAELPGERHEFIRHLLHSRFMPKPDEAAELVADMTPRDILDFALSFEKDTIIFLYEMRDMVAAADAAGVDKIIAEEKRHVSRITRARETLP